MTGRTEHADITLLDRWRSSELVVVVVALQLFCCRALLSQTKIVAATRASTHCQFKNRLPHVPGQPRPHYSTNHSSPIPTSPQIPASSGRTSSTNSSSVRQSGNPQHRQNGDPTTSVRLLRSSSSPSCPIEQSGALPDALEGGQGESALWLTTCRFNQEILIDTTPLPDNIPAVKEIGASSAPLLSASFFIGARCRDYNDDYMQCKTENPGRGEFDCMKEGRRVTRCAQSVYVPSISLMKSSRWPGATSMIDWKPHWD